MNLISRLIVRALYRFSGRLPCRLIPLPSGPYLERYYLGFWQGEHRYLHRFVANDAERHLHDHPWRAASSWVLTGWYIEEAGTLIGRTILGGTRKVRWFNRLRRSTHSRDLHRITEIRPETWTLFSHTAWEHPWGFYDTADNWPLRYVTAYHEFKPTPDDSAGSQWWLTAPPGRFADREPLRT